LSERRVIILGSTGSIGTQSLEVIDHLNALHAHGECPSSFRVVGLAAGTQTKMLAQQATRYGCKNVAISNGDLVGSDHHVFRGQDAPERLVKEVECDLVIGAIVGAAGLPATLAAVELGRDIALANKETLVAAGELVVPAARRSGSKLLPVDSEHAAAWQCLAGIEGSDAVPPMRVSSRVERLVLTASGGPFRTKSREEIERATPAEALKHPTWNMGRKVTIDSATLMNKVLEVIEAHWLFGLESERIGVAVHPQSMVHAAAELCDGSVIAHLSAPDMRCPIQAALSWPHRTQGVCRRVRLEELTGLAFEKPDETRFPAVTLARRVIGSGGTSGAVLNAANEAAVEAFLSGALSFGDIPRVVAEALDAIAVTALKDLETCLEADRSAREWVAKRIEAKV
jgi:1-deoxy-D-xylulose-5-phosphate reductoisomerase